jgi:glycosyltransferase involved in cell wall biosynthesis
MAAFYSAGDVFAFPGIRESLGMVFLEAQAASLPVVAFKNGGIPEVVSDQQTGYLIPMYDCSAFCDRLAFLLNNENHRTRMGRAAAAYVRTRHDMNENYKLFEQMLVKVTA